MNLIFNYIIFFLILIVFSLFDYSVKKNNPLRNLIIFFVVSFIIIFVALRDGNYLNDYMSYFEIYLFDNIRIEPAFRFLRNCFYYNMGNPYKSFSYFMMFYAFLSLFIKVIDINRFSNYFFLSILIYFSDLLLLHEFTQIRAGLACGLTIYSLRYVYERKNVKFLLCSLIAISFHFSAVVGLIFYFLNPKNINKKMWIGLLFFSYILPFVGFNPFILAKFIPIEYIQYKLQTYIQFTGKAHTFTIFSLTKTLLVLYLLFMDKEAVSKNKYFYLLIKVQLISIISVGFFSANETAAIRFSEYLSCTGFLLFPSIVDVSENKILAKIGLVLICCVWLYLRLFRYGMISYNVGEINVFFNPISNLQW